MAYGCQTITYGWGERLESQKFSELYVFFIDLSQYVDLSKSFCFVEIKQANYLTMK